MTIRCNACQQAVEMMTNRTPFEYCPHCGQNYLARGVDTASLAAERRKAEAFINRCSFWSFVIFSATAATGLAYAPLSVPSFILACLMMIGGYALNMWGPKCARNRYPQAF